LLNIKIKEEINIEQLSVDEKGGRLDLQAKLNDGIIVNIELQITGLKKEEIEKLLNEIKES
jgi:ribosome-interacting GTPase 1